MNQTFAADHLTRLRDAGVISAEEFRAARERLDADKAPPKRRNLTARIAIGVGIGILAAILVLLEASLLGWITMAALIFAGALVFVRDDKKPR